MFVKNCAFLNTSKFNKNKHMNIFKRVRCKLKHLSYHLQIC